MQITKKNIAIFAKDESLNSYEFWKILNNIRQDRGASPIRHNDFIARVIDEIDDLPRCESFVPSRQSNSIDTYQLTKRQMLLIGMRESKAIRKQVLNWLDLLIAKVSELEKQKVERAKASLKYIEQSNMVKHVRDAEGKETKDYHYSNEANLLNGIVLGMSAAKYRLNNGLEPSDNLRDTLTPIKLECLASLEVLNTSLISAGIEYAKRKEMLLNVHKRDFSERLINEHMRIEG